MGLSTGWWRGGELSPLLVSAVFFLLRALLCVCVCVLTRDTDAMQWQVFEVEGATDRENEWKR